MGTNQRWHRTLIRQLLVLTALIVLAFIFYPKLQDLLTRQGRLKMSIVDSTGGLRSTFWVELADSPQKRSRGLMYRRPPQLNRDSGMLFVFPDSAQRTFWMKNTYISLDMLFFDEQCKLVALVPKVPILNEIPRSSSVPAKFVLEIHSGLAEQLSLKVGDRCSFESELPSSVD